MQFQITYIDVSGKDNFVWQVVLNVDIYFFDVFKINLDFRKYFFELSLIYLNIKETLLIYLCPVCLYKKQQMCYFENCAGT